MNDVAPTIEVGMVVTPGRHRRDELRKLLGLPASARMVYFYVGRYGQEDLGWGRLGRLAAREIHFVGFHGAPEGAISNLHVVPPTEWTGADLASSTDAMVAKAGYGTACEAMVAGTPPPQARSARSRARNSANPVRGG
jgi:hypothetical protein